MEKVKGKKAKTKVAKKTKETKKGKSKENKKGIEVKLSEERIEKALRKESTFINETQLNEKMINNFYKFHRRKIRRSDFVSLIFCGLVLIIVGINCLLEGSDYFFGLICNIIINTLLISLGIYLWSYALKYQKYDRKESKKIYGDDISTYINYYYFNEEMVIIKNKIGKTERYYNCLEAIYETKEFYYILITKNSGYVMKKDSFKKGEEEEFHKFIKEKMGKNYKKRCLRRRSTKKNNIEVMEEKKTVKTKNNEIKNKNIYKKTKSKK